MNKELVLHQIMKHAVTGHSGPPNVSASTPNERLGYHTFCTDWQHAEDILTHGKFVLRPAFSRSQERRLDAQLESEAVDRFVSEGGVQSNGRRS